MIEAFQIWNRQPSAQGYIPSFLQPSTPSSKPEGAISKPKKSPAIFDIIFDYLTPFSIERLQEIWLERDNFNLRKIVHLHIITNHAYECYCKKSHKVNKPQIKQFKQICAAVFKEDPSFFNLLVNSPRCLNIFYAVIAADHLNPMRGSKKLTTDSFKNIIETVKAEWEAHQWDEQELIMEGKLTPLGASQEKTILNKQTEELFQERLKTLKPIAVKGKKEKRKKDDSVEKSKKSMKKQQMLFPMPTVSASSSSSTDSTPTISTSSSPSSIEVVSEDLVSSGFSNFSNKKKRKLFSKLVKGLSEKVIKAVTFVLNPDDSSRLPLRKGIKSVTTKTRIELENPYTIGAKKLKKE